MGQGRAPRTRSPKSNCKSRNADSKPLRDINNKKPERGCCSMLWFFLSPRAPEAARPWQSSAGFLQFSFDGSEAVLHAVQTPVLTANDTMRVARLGWLGAATIALAACQSNTPPASNQAAQNPKQAPPTAIPANVSHGEAHVGTAVDQAPVDPAPPPRATEHLIHVRFVIRDTLIEVSKGVAYRAWAFEGRVPGPTIRATQGDSVDFTLVNHGVMPHSMDFHAAQIAPSKYYVNVNPNDSIHYRFNVEVPGVFMYHCGT